MKKYVLLIIMIILLTGCNKSNKTVLDKTNDTTKTVSEKYIKLYNEAKDLYGLYSNYYDTEVSTLKIEDYNLLTNKMFKTKEILEENLNMYFPEDIVNKLIKLGEKKELFKIYQDRIYYKNDNKSNINNNMIEEELNVDFKSNEDITIHANFKSNNNLLVCNKDYDYKIIKVKNRYYQFTNFKLPIEVCLDK